MTLFLVFCGLGLCFFCPFLIILFLILFILYCMAGAYGVSVILLPLGVICFAKVWFMICNPIVDKAKKQARMAWDEYDAVKLYLNDPEEFHRQLQATQPKMSAETKARVRRIQKQLAKEKKDRVDIDLPIAKDYPSSHKKR